MASRHRIWIVRHSGPRPAGWQEIPAGATALEPAERGTLSARQARRYVEAFNRAAHSDSQKLWAVAVPVAVCYVGDPQPGAIIGEVAPSSPLPVGKGEGRVS